MADLANALNAFAAWRSTRTSSKEKIPDSLWAMACSLVDVHGRARVASALSLNHSQLMRKLADAPRVTPSVSNPVLASMRVTPLVIHQEAARPVRKEATVVAELLCKGDVRLKLYDGISAELMKALLSYTLEAK